jgi:peptidyl-prolyl cis-trans isomerase SurA
MNVRASACAAGLVLVMMAGPARAEPARRTMLDRVVAVVGSDIVTLVELRSRARPFLARLVSIDAAARPVAEMQIYRDLLDKMIDERIVDRWAAVRRVTVSGAEIDAALDAVAKNNKVTRVELLAEAAAQGLDVTMYRAELARQILQHKVGQIAVYPRVYEAHAGEPEAAVMKALDKAMREFLDEQRREIHVEARL